MLSASKIAFMPALALHSAMPSPQDKAEGEPAVALGGDAGDLGAHDVEGAGRDDVGGGGEMVADGGGIGEQRVGGDPCRDCRKQGDQRIESDVGGERARLDGRDETADVSPTRRTSRIGSARISYLLSDRSGRLRVTVSTGSLGALRSASASGFGRGVGTSATALGSSTSHWQIL
jgi:hypothetical protein